MHCHARESYLQNSRNPSSSSYVCDAWRVLVLADTSPPALFIVPLIQETVKSHAVVYLSVQVCRGGAKLAAQSSVNR